MDQQYLIDPITFGPWPFCQQEEHKTASERIAITMNTVMFIPIMAFC